MMRLQIGVVACVAVVAKGGKAGIAAHLKNGDGDTDAVAGSQISWNYNWAMQGAGTGGLDYYPQIWSGGNMGQLGNMADASVWLGFNEPNMNSGGGGSSMSVADVVGYWPQIEEAAKAHGVTTLVGPNVANINPEQWYDDFFSQCSNCRVDAIGFHSYSCDLQSMQSLVSKLQKYGKPLWLTEFACADNPNSIAGNDGGSKTAQWQCEYMKQVIPYLESESSIAKYAWFGFDTEYTGESKLVSGGQLTDLGNCYNSVASGAPAPGPTPPAPTPPSPAPSPLPAPTEGACCYGESCDSASCSADGYCGENEGQCTGDCGGMWCGKASVFV